MAKFNNSGDNDRLAAFIDDAQLDAVVGGAPTPIALSPQLALAYLPVGGWGMKDNWAPIPTLGTFH
jgi:hypothetical protein